MTAKESINYDSVQRLGRDRKSELAIEKLVDWDSEMSIAAKQVSEQYRDSSIGVTNLEANRPALVCAYAGNQDANANEREITTNTLQFNVWEKVGRRLD